MVDLTSLKKPKGKRTIEQPSTTSDKIICPIRLKNVCVQQLHAAEVGLIETPNSKRTSLLRLSLNPRFNSSASSPRLAQKYRHVEEKKRGGTREKNRELEKRKEGGQERRIESWKEEWKKRLISIYYDRRIGKQPHLELNVLYAWPPHEGCLYDLCNRQ
ncbi:hypothetical protein J437_LFUL013215 [Ladona fulva]|uniref:Uncharacterized protein n=1 Tax=Ladona fulva TaxID=123851 RepID=A0A8K0KPG6_LADFU|nr:hypothetical protein J437_LFUL013215 [Ladona fulva]